MGGRAHRDHAETLRYLDDVRLIAGAFTLVLLTVSVGAQTSRLGDIIARLDGYLQGYEDRLANVVAEETYRQWVEQGSKDRRSTTTRMLRSDFALTPTSERNSWVGYRDTFEVDGVPVRDRDERLQRLLSSGAVGQAARIAEQNARFNLGEGLITRNINVPTFALEMMHPRFRDRVKVRRTGADVLEGRPGWLIEFREQDRLTFVHTPEGGDQPSRVVARRHPDWRSAPDSPDLGARERVDRGVLRPRPRHSRAGADPHGRALRHTQWRARRRRGDLRQLPAVRDERTDRPMT